MSTPAMKPSSTPPATSASAPGSAPRPRRFGAAFISVSIILIVAAAALNFTTASKGLHYKKSPVPQPREFQDLPPVMGKWMQVSLDKKMDPELEDVLGTDKYVYRDYVRVDKCGADLLTLLSNAPVDPNNHTIGAALDAMNSSTTSQAQLEFDNASFDKQVEILQQALSSKTDAQRQRITFLLQLQHPDAVVNMGLTYYTGLVDTVAHIPDRCYIAAGYEPSEYSKPVWPVGQDASGKPQSLQVRFMKFEDQTAEQGKMPKCVAYVFNTNGHYDPDSLGVRMTLQDLTQRYGYYAKIELMTNGHDPTKASAGMADFLTAAKPFIETCLPDWNHWLQTHSS